MLVQREDPNPPTLRAYNVERIMEEQGAKFSIFFSSSDRDLVNCSLLAMLNVGESIARKLASGNKSMHG